MESKTDIIRRCDALEIELHSVVADMRGISSKLNLHAVLAQKANAIRAEIAILNERKRLPNEVHEVAALPVRGVGSLRT